MIYVSYSQGYKSGGFNAADDQNPAFADVNGVKTPLRTVLVGLSMMMKLLTRLRLVVNTHLQEILD